MPVAPGSSPEKIPKKPTPVESVEDFIARKKSEKGTEGAREVQASAEGIQKEVSEVLAGVEKPKEELTEKGEKKSEPGAGGGGQAGAAAAQALGDDDWKSVIFPDEEVMVKKIRTAIEVQIKLEWKKATKLRGKLTSGGAQEYTTVIARIRSLKKVLTSLLTATMDYLKELYMKYFRPDGRRRDPEEVAVD